MQRHSMAFIIGAIANLLVVVHAIPEAGVGMAAVPHLAVTPLVRPRAGRAGIGGHQPPEASQPAAGD